MKKFYIFLFLMVSFCGLAQTDSIQIQVSYEGNSPIIKVKQAFNLHQKNREETYLYAWANAYKHKHTTLGETKLNNRKDNFFFTRLEERGWIEELKFYTNQNQPIAFEYTDEELLKVETHQPFYATYKIHLPSTKITGYGIDKEGNLLLKYFFLHPTIIQNNKVKKQEFKDFESLTSANTHYDLEISVPRDFIIYTDLKSKGNSLYEGNVAGFPQISVQRSNTTRTVETHLGKVIFGYKIDDTDFIQIYPVIQRELLFMQEHLGEIQSPLYISHKNYRKNKFSGVQDIDIPILGKYKMFNTQDRLNLELISQLSASYTQRKILIDNRKDHWIVNGISAYLQNKYIQKYYSDLLIAGNIPEDIHIFGIHPLKIFEAAKVKMPERSALFYQLFFLNNLDQPVNTPFDELSNMNQSIVSSYKAALGLEYLSAYLGEEKFDEVLLSFIKKYEGKTITADIFSNYINQHTPENLSWFFNDFLGHDKNIDLAITSVKKQKDSLTLKIKNRTEFTGPIRISGYKDGQKTYDKWYNYQSKKQQINIQNKDYDLIVLNDSIGYPDFNQQNNYYKPNSLFKRKMKIGFFTDIPSYEYAQIFFRPEIQWNYYDKLLLGMKFSNKTILPKKWIYTIKPQYSIGEGKLVGRFNTKYNLFLRNAWFSKIGFFAGGGYSHYDKELAFRSYGGGVSAAFNTSPRSLVRRSVTASYSRIDRDMPLDATLKELELGKYSLYNLGYNYWNSDVIHERKAYVNFQYSDKFTKVFGEVYWRWQFRKDKRLTARLFAGAFLGHKLDESTYFDFGLDRISDYTFQYPLLGRSETTGILSQQYVIAEGGFKSNFFAKANKYMATLNLEYPFMFDMLDVYADAGIYKNRNEPAQFVYGTGISVRVIPDFLEVFFPIQSTLGFEPTLGAYHERIRFMLNLDLGKVISYWRRGRF